jgi:hypothetical protein
LVRKFTTAFCNARNSSGARPAAFRDLPVIKRLFPQCAPGVGLRHAHAALVLHVAFAAYISHGLQALEQRRHRAGLQEQFFTQSLDGLPVFFPQANDGDVLRVGQAELFQHRLVDAGIGEVGRIDGEAHEITQLRGVLALVAAVAHLTSPAAHLRHDQTNRCRCAERRLRGRGTGQRPRGDRAAPARRGTTRFLDANAVRNGEPAALAADVVALMGALKIDKAVLAGYDWGARTAGIVAALWPQRVKGLISVSGYLIGSQRKTCSR